AYVLLPCGLLRHDVPGAVALRDVSIGATARARAGNCAAVPGAELHRDRRRSAADGFHQPHDRQQPAGSRRACCAGSADGLRYALCIIVFTFAWSTFHYYRAMRTLRQEELPA